MSAISSAGAAPAVATDGAWACPSCGRPAEGAFCAGCGERRPSPHAMSLRHLAAELAEHLTTLDTKIVRTVALLFARPGALLVEYRRGARARYTSPLQLFVWTNVAFFFLVSWLRFFHYTWDLAVDPDQITSGFWSEVLRTKVRAAGSPAAMHRAYDAAVGARTQGLFALVVPTLALALAALHPRRRTLEHLLMAIYLTPPYMLALVAEIAVLRALFKRLHLTPAGLERLSPVMLAIAGGCFGVHAALALRRAYGDRWAAALARGAALGATAYYFPRLFLWVVVHVTVALL